MLEKLNAMKGRVMKYRAGNEDIELAPLTGSDFGYLIGMLPILSSLLPFASKGNKNGLDAILKSGTIDENGFLSLKKLIDSILKRTFPFESVKEELESEGFTGKGAVTEWKKRIGEIGPDHFAGIALVILQELPAIINTISGSFEESEEDPLV